MNPFIKTLSEVEYNALPALRSTLLKEFMQSPKKYKYRVDHPETSQDRSYFILGSFVHALILEPDEVASKFVACSVKSRVAKEYTRVKEEHPGKGVLLLDEYEAGQRMAEVALADRAIKELVDQAFTEVSAMAQISGVWCKARFDGLIPERGIVFDIKTTSDTLHWFPHNTKKFGYDVSAPFYVDVANTAGVLLPDGTPTVVDDYRFIVIEKEPPYDCGIFSAKDSFLAKGRTKYLEALERFKVCLASNNWPGRNNANPIELEG